MFRQVFSRNPTLARAEFMAYPPGDRNALDQQDQLTAQGVAAPPAAPLAAPVMDLAPTPEPSLTSRVARGTGWVMAGRIVSRNLGLLSTLVLVRLLRPEDFGLVTLATGFVNTIDSLSAIGVQDALVRDVAPDRDRYDTAFCLNVLRGVPPARILAGLAWPIASFFSDPRLSNVMFALALMMLIGSFGNIGLVQIRRELEFQREFKLFVAIRAVSILTTIALGFIWPDYWAFVSGLLLGRIIAVAISYSMAPYWPRFSLRSWRYLIGFSFWTWLGTMLNQVKDRGDSIIIGRMLGTAQFGVFSVGQELGALPVTEVIEPMGRALFSGFALLHRTEESPRTLYLRAVATVMMLILPAGFGISMVADPMVRAVLGEQWLSVLPVIQVVAIISPLSVFGSVSSTFLTAGGRPRMAFILSTV